MNYDDLIKSVAQDTGLNPTPWDQEGASELKINFKPDGSYTKQIQGTWKPVAQLAQQMAKGREPSPSMKGMSPEMILQFADRQGAAGEQRKRDLGLFAGIVEKMQGQKAAARQQDFEEHKYNNPDLVKLPGVPVPIKRDQVTQALRDQAAQRLKEGRLSAEKYGLITEMLDAKDMMRTRGAQRAASYASAGRAKSAEDLNRLKAQSFFNMKDYDPRLPNAMAQVNDLPWSNKGFTAGMGWETGGAGETDEPDFFITTEGNRWREQFKDKIFDEEGNPRNVTPSEISSLEAGLPERWGIVDVPLLEETTGSWMIPGLRNTKGTGNSAYIFVDKTASPEDQIISIFRGLRQTYGKNAKHAMDTVGPVIDKAVKSGSVTPENGAKLKAILGAAE